MDSYYLLATFLMAIVLCLMGLLIWNKIQDIAKWQEYGDNDRFNDHKEIMDFLRELDRKQLVIETRLQERAHVEEGTWEYQFAGAAIPIDSLPIKRKRGRPPKAIGEIKNPPRGTEGQE